MTSERLEPSGSVESIYAAAAEREDFGLDGAGNRVLSSFQTLPTPLRITPKLTFMTQSVDHLEVSAEQLAVQAPDLNWEFLRSQDVPQRLIAGIEAAEDRFGMQAMLMVHDETTGPCFSAVQARCLDRMLEIAVAADSPSVDPHPEDGVPGREPKSETLKQALDIIDSLGPEAIVNLGVPSGALNRLVWHNALTRLLRRDHRKAIVVDNESFLLTSNIHASALDGDQIAYALRSDNRLLADELFENIKQAALGGRPKKDTAVEIAPGNILLSNAGRFGQSLILDAAIEFVKDAEPDTLRFVSQHRPGGKLEAALVSSEPVFAAYNGLENIYKVLQWERQSAERNKPSIPNTLIPDSYVHGQTLSLVVRPNPDRRFLPEYEGPLIMTGNDNKYWAGRWVCAAELEIISTDEKLFDQVNTTLDEDFR